ENKPTIARERREQPEPGRPDYDAAALGWRWKAKFCVGDYKPAAVALAVEMFLHRMARDAVGAACTEDVSRREILRLTTKRHQQVRRAIFDRPYPSAVFDLDAKALQMFAQNFFGAPLRKAALKFILAPDISKFGGRDFLQTRPQQLNLPDMHTRAK